LAGGWTLALVGGAALDQYLRVRPLADFHAQANEIFAGVEKNLVDYQEMMDVAYDTFQTPGIITKEGRQGYLDRLQTKPGQLGGIQWKAGPFPLDSFLCKKWSNIKRPAPTSLTWHLPLPGTAKPARNRPQAVCAGALEATFDVEKLFAHLFKAAIDQQMGIRIDAYGPTSSSLEDMEHKKEHEEPQIFIKQARAEDSGPWSKDNNFAFYTFRLHVVLSAPKQAWNAEWPGVVFFTLGSALAWALYRLSRQRDERSLQDRGHQLGLRQRGEDVAFIAHELAQPLTAISGCLESLLVRLNRDDLPAEILARDLPVAFQQARRASDFLEEIRGQVAGQGDRQRRSVAVGEVFRSVAALARVDSRFHDITLAAKGGADLHVMASPAALEMVLLNLLRNSAEAIRDEGQGGAIVLEARPEGEQVKIRLEDDGPGISQPDELFQPFKSTKDYGTGLGLVHCKHQVGRFGGSIKGGNRAEGGAWFEIVLPVASEESSRVVV